MAASLVAFGVGCSESTPTQPGADARSDAATTGDTAVSSDASTESDAATSGDASTSETSTDDVNGVDTMIPDVSSTADARVVDTTSTGDADAGCGCVVTREGPGVMTAGSLSMPCFCAKEDWPVDFRQRPTCPSYDDAINCSDASPYFAIETYKNCNFVTVNYWPGNAVDMRVYDATTHELVGARRGNDFAIGVCDSRAVAVVESGIVPGPECEIAKEQTPCGGLAPDAGDVADATSDAGDATDATNDASGCACTLGDADSLARVSLDCYCKSIGECPSYRDAVATCVGLPFEHGLEEYAGCNVSVIATHWPSYHEYRHYDFTTHELLGVWTSARDLIACGGKASGYRAGNVTIDPTCTLTRAAERCGGDAGADL